MRTEQEIKEKIAEVEHDQDAQDKDFTYGMSIGSKCALQWVLSDGKTETETK